MKILKAMLVIIPFMAAAVFAVSLYVHKPAPDKFSEFIGAERLSVSAINDALYSVNGKNLVDRDFYRLIDVIIQNHKIKAVPELKDFPDIILKPQIEFVVQSNCRFYRFQKLIEMLTQQLFANISVTVVFADNSRKSYDIPIPLPSEFTGKPEKASYLSRDGLSAIDANSSLLILKEDGNAALHANYGIYSELLKAQKQGFNEKTGEQQQVEIPFISSAVIQKDSLGRYIETLRKKPECARIVVWYMPLADTEMSAIAEVFDALLVQGINYYELVLTEHVH